MTAAAIVPFCYGCGYRLDHLTLPRCPECGRQFNPGDPNTFSVSPRRVSQTFLRIVRCPAWPFPAAGAALVLWQLWEQRLPFAAPVWAMRPLVRAWLILAALWLILAIALPVLARLRKIPPAFRPPGRRRWVPFLLVPLAAYGLSVANADFGISFFLSRPALSALVVEAKARFPIVDWTKRTEVGLLPVTRVYSTRETVVIVLSSDAVLVHSDLQPELPPGRIESIARLPYADGHWYLCRPGAGGRTFLTDLRTGIRRAILRDLVLNPDPARLAFLLYCLRELRNPPFASNPTAYLITFPDPDLHEQRQWLLGFGRSQIIPEEMQALARLGPAAMPALIALLDAGTPDAVPAVGAIPAIGALALIGPPARSAAPHIAPFLSSRDPYIRVAAANALRLIDSPACSQRLRLVAALQDPNPLVVLNVLLALEAGTTFDDVMLAYARCWRRLVTRDIPDKSINVMRNDYIPAEEACKGVIARRLKSTPAVNTVPLVASTLDDLFDALQKHPPPPWLSDLDAANDWRPALAERDSLAILQELGPTARAALPDLVELLRFHFRTGERGVGRASAPEFAAHDNSPAACVSNAIAAVAPAAPDAVTFLLTELQATRVAAHEQWDEPAQMNDEELAVWQFAMRSVATQRSFRQEGLAYALQIIDPGNRAIRDLLRGALAAPVDAPERLWAASVAAQTPLPDELLVAALAEMLSDGHREAVYAALHTALSLNRAVAEPLLARYALRNPATIQNDPARPQRLITAATLEAAADDVRQQIASSTAAPPGSSEKLAERVRQFCLSADLVGGDSTDTSIAAATIRGSNGTAAAKAAALAPLLTETPWPENRIVLQDLIALHVPLPALREALIRMAFGSPNEATRTLARSALEMLFP